MTITNFSLYLISVILYIYTIIQEMNLSTISMKRMLIKVSVWYAALTVLELSFPTCSAEKIRIAVDFCRPCHNRIGHRMVADDKTRLYNDVIETVIQLTSTNTQQICRFYNDIFEGDLSAVEEFDRRDIPAAHRRVHNYRSKIVATYSNLTTIAMYYKLGNLRRETTDGLTLPSIEHRIQSILCALHSDARASNIFIPTSACYKSMTIPHNLPSSRAEFARWVFSILRENRLDFCNVFNALALKIGSATLQCGRLPQVDEVCSS